MKAVQAVLITLAFAPLLSAVPGFAALSPQQKCQVAKLKAAGKEIAGKMVCYVKAKATAVPVVGDCLSKAQAKADTAINKAGNACTGLAAGVESDVDTCVVARGRDAGRRPVSVGQRQGGREGCRGVTRLPVKGGEQAR